MDGSYRSSVFKLAVPFQPPTAYSAPPAAPAASIFRGVCMFGRTSHEDVLVSNASSDGSSPWPFCSPPTTYSFSPITTPAAKLLCRATPIKSVNIAVGMFNVHLIRPHTSLWVPAACSTILPFVQRWSLRRAGSSCTRSTGACSMRSGGGGNASGNANLAGRHRCSLMCESKHNYSTI